MDPPDLSMDMASLGLDESELYDENPIPDLLGRELAVKLDKRPWQNVLVDVSDEGEEAVIVLYGLMPGRHYEVELTVVSAKEPLRKHIITDVDSDASADDHNAEAPEASNSETSNAKTVSLPIPAPSQLPAPPRMITVEERASQLRHNLSLLTNEKESLLQQLKNARKDTQRAESSLRAEMDALKRASEKQTATEHRTRQKVLALQEAVKQALAAAEEAEEEIEQVQASIPPAEAQSKEVEHEHDRLREEAKQSAADTESVINTSRKRISDMQGELSALTHRLDRLTGKKDRLENEALPDLENQLQGLRTLYENLEKDSSTASRDESAFTSTPQTSHLPAIHSHKGRVLPIGRPNTSPRPANKTPRRPGILNVPHILQRTAQ